MRPRVCATDDTTITRAGAAAQEWAVGNGLSEPERESVERETFRIASRIQSTGTGLSPSFSVTIRSLRTRLRSAVQRDAGVSRDRAGLMRLRQEAGEIQKELAELQVPAERIYNQALLDLLQLEAMCGTAEVIAGSALLRTESRGHHFRTDFPAPDDEHWRQHTCVVSAAGRPKFGVQPIAGE